MTSKTTRLAKDPYPEYRFVWDIFYSHFPFLESAQLICSQSTDNVLINNINNPIGELQFHLIGKNTKHLDIFIRKNVEDSQPISFAFSTVLQTQVIDAGASISTQNQQMTVHMNIINSIVFMQQFFDPI
jgi:hypothetical protein